MEDRDVIREKSGPIARARLDRARYRDAQSWRILGELDRALGAAAADPEVKVIVLSGEGPHFSAGHDLGTPEQREAQERVGTWGGPYYDAFRHYNLELTLRWRNLPIPTIAMVHGHCIYGGWMIASAMDPIFASEDALFRAGLVEYFSVPWDVGPRAAKELLFESRFLTAHEARELGLVSRVYPREQLGSETLAYARRVAENPRLNLRLAQARREPDPRPAGVHQRHRGDLPRLLGHGQPRTARTGERSRCLAGRAPGPGREARPPPPGSQPGRPSRTGEGARAAAEVTPGPTRVRPPGPCGGPRASRSPAPAPRARRAWPGRCRRSPRARGRGRRGERSRS